VPVQRETRHIEHAEVDRGVTGHDTAAVHRFAEDHVVDVSRSETGARQRFGHDRVGEVEGGRLGERSFERRSDSRPAGGDDDRVGHVELPLDYFGRGRPSSCWAMMLRWISLVPA